MVTRKNAAAKEKIQIAARKMNDEIIAIYCLYDDILNAMNHCGDPQQELSNAEVMSTAIPRCIFVEITRRQENICQNHNTF